MQLTETEVKFLVGEHASHGLRALPYIGLETLKTNRERSLSAIRSLVERRAKILGSTFTDFQKSQRPVETAAPSSLNAAELF